MSKAKVTAG